MKIFTWLLLSVFTFCVHAQINLLPETNIKTAAMATLHLKGYPDFLAEDEEGVWITNEERVEKLEFGKQGIVRTVNIPSPCGAMVTGFASLWVASCERRAVYRIDLKSGVIQSVISTGLADDEGELSLAIGGGSVWLLTKSDGELSRIDPVTNKVQSRIRVEANSFAVAFGFESVWITNTNSASVQRVDPVTEKITATIPVGKGPRFLTAGAGAVWTLNQEDGTITKIDPNTNQSMSIDVGAAGSGGDIAAGSKYVYVRAKNTLLSVIDPQTNKVISRLGPPAGSGAVGVENGRVWITAHDMNTIWVLKE